MKPYAIIGICALAMASCTGNESKNADTTQNTGKDTLSVVKPNTQAKNMEYCFLRTEGTSNQDTTAVHLVINDDKVSGNMLWQPKEKDARKGTLLGKMAGDDISAVWTFMQEGMKDSMRVEFKLSAQQLAQKPYKVTKDGRQETDNTADYTIIYKLDNCGKFKTAVKPAL